jgi:hypothetical protein
MIKYLFFCIILSLVAAAMPPPVFAESGHATTGRSLMHNGDGDDCGCCDQSDQKAANPCRSCCAITAAPFIFPANNTRHSNIYDDRLTPMMVGKTGSPEPPPPRS